MSEATRSYPGHLPLAAGRTVSLEPRHCGVLKVGAGRIAVGDTLLVAGDTLRLWRGDAVDVANVMHTATAFFAWDACVDQPSLRERVRLAISGLLSAASRPAVPKLAACGEARWCAKH
jgi:hypothetical protein